MKKKIYLKVFISLIVVITCCYIANAYVNSSQFTNQSIGYISPGYFFNDQDIITTSAGENYDVVFNLVSVADVVEVEIFDGEETLYNEFWYNVSSGADYDIGLPDNCDCTWYIRVDYASESLNDNFSELDPPPCGVWSGGPFESK